MRTFVTILLILAVVLTVVNLVLRFFKKKREK